MVVSRMDKYKNNSTETMSRIQKNQDIYNSTDIGELSRIKTNNNVSVISDAPKEIDIDKIRNYIYSQNGEDIDKKRVSLELPKEEKKEVVRKEEKDYDINSVLEHARDKREISFEDNKYRKFTEEAESMEILKNININEATKFDEDEDITGPIDELNTEEKTIVELIQDIQSHKTSAPKEDKKDLFDDLMGDEDETVVMGMSSENEEIKDALLNITQDLESSKLPETEFTNEIKSFKEELKQKAEEYNSEENATSPKINTIDKSFYTNSMTFSTSDFEGFEDLEKNANESSTFSKIAIVIIIIMLLAAIFLIMNYVLGWNII